MPALGTRANVHVIAEPSGSVGKAGAGSAGPGPGRVAGFGNRGGEGGQVRISVEYRRVCDYLCPVQESETVLHKRQRDNVTCAEHVTRGPPGHRGSRCFATRTATRGECERDQALRIPYPSIHPAVSSSIPSSPAHATLSCRPNSVRYQSCSSLSSAASPSPCSRPRPGAGLGWARIHGRREQAALMHVY